MMGHLLLKTLIFLNSMNVIAQPTSFKDTIAAYFDEIKAATAGNRNVWDFDLYAPILLVQPDTRQVYANFPDTAGVLKQDGKIFTGTMPQSVNIANTATHWSGIDWAMVMLPLPDDRNDRLNLLTHELFHRAQPHLGFKLANADNNHLDKKEGRIYLRLELEALKAALFAASSGERERHITDALIFRGYRHAVYPGADSTENILELNEGLAEYTGAVMSGRDQRQMHDHFVESMNRFLANPTFVRSFAYQTIPLYGWLLQSTDKEWNRHITSETNLTAYFLQAFDIRLPGDLKRAVSDVADGYGYRTVAADEAAREKRIEKLVAEYTKAFIKRPHLDIPLSNMSVSFDPRNIMPLEDKGTVYPNLRITDDWGILTVTKGALLSPAWNRVTVDIPTRIDEGKVLGDGWTLELKPGFFVQKEDANGNFVLKRNKENIGNHLHFVVSRPICYAANWIRFSESSRIIPVQGNRLPA